MPQRDPQERRQALVAGSTRLHVPRQHNQVNALLLQDCLDLRLLRRLACRILGRDGQVPEGHAKPLGHHLQICRRQLGAWGVRWRQRQGTTRRGRVQTRSVFERRLQFSQARHHLACSASLQPDQAPRQHDQRGQNRARPKGGALPPWRQRARSWTEHRARPGAGREQRRAPGWLEMMMGIVQFSSPFSMRMSRSYRQWSSLLRGGARAQQDRHEGHGGGAAGPSTQLSRSGGAARSRAHVSQRPAGPPALSACAGLRTCPCVAAAADPRAPDQQGHALLLG